MTVSFNQIPSNLLVPLFYAEFDNSKAVTGSAGQPYKVLMIGNKLASGTVAALTPTTITSKGQGEAAFGKGSVLADMLAKYLRNSTTIELLCVGVDDAGAGVAATGNILFGGVATKAGTVSAMVGGVNVKAAVAVGDTADVVENNFRAALALKTEAVVTGVENATVEQIDLTARNKGEHGNFIDVRFNFFKGETLPAGITAVVTPMSGGTGNPDVDTVWPVLNEDQCILVTTPWTDASNVAKVETELADRFGPLRQNDGYAIYGLRDDFAGLGTYVDTRNSQFTTVMGMDGPSSPWQWSSAIVGQAASSSNIDPARPFQTLVLVDILAPDTSEVFSLTERNILLNDGVATYVVNSGGSVQIEALVTTFTENAFGDPDTSYQYLNTVLTLSFIRFDLKAKINSTYPRHKLVSDGTRYDAGQAVVTPNVIKGEIIGKFEEWEAKALVENFVQFKNELIVERDPDNRNRINVLMPPDIANQLRVVGVKVQFLL